MVQQRSELYNLVLFSYPPHAIQRIWHILIPALRPGSVLLDHVPLGQPPSLHRLRNRRSSLVRRLRRYYGVVRLPVFVHHWITILDLPNASPLTTSTGKTRDLPVLAHGVSVHARGLRLRRVVDALAISHTPMLPSVPGNDVGSLPDVISQLHILPVRAPANASSVPLREQTHDSGSS